MLSTVLCIGSGLEAIATFYYNSSTLSAGDTQRSTGRAISSPLLLERIVVNIIHLFPYVNCALNPLLYAYGTENFRIAFKSMFMYTNR
ncbi:unnamed protein product [Cylicostephanus goldi]|uniref:G-protein coupled receptors family 1 profile domain-containing protein n=1 Tax=Cylicostephanus goldi TaxID=71465 RepID=A0A3P6S7K4_CYLGO|nr:unnamed protein product [Cylicostephanus goldi]